MSFESAQNDLQAKGYGDRIIVTSQSSATVALAAQALGIEEGRIAKTLSFMVGDVPVLILAAGMQELITINTRKHSTKKQR